MWHALEERERDRGRERGWYVAYMRRERARAGAWAVYSMHEEREREGGSVGGIQHALVSCRH